MRRAVSADLPRIVAMLTDDPLGQGRESGLMDATYRSAFEAIDRDPSHFLAVADRGGKVIGTLQLSFLPGLARHGAWRGQIEAVRVAREVRGQGIGRFMFEWAIEKACAQGCSLVQLTSDAARTGAHDFYDALGFQPSHVGYKLLF
ncbi:GNAT family N-acetyltransferase [Thalassobius aquimarinus]|uniref:GNAT family N-acetyltransferase n=2 Tax=Thalassovita aquimarina TaxID=2785917 RepID=A0ABS5HRS9_9RHOB|nr:GNAT family N-acetyltransferase [Thalassovita aquimarina]